MKILACGVLLALLAACSDTSGPRAIVTRIDATSTAPDGSLVVEYTITNAGLRREEILACAGRALPNVEKQNDGRWESFSGAFCQANLSMVPISLAAGSSTGGVTVIFGPPGVYRLVILYNGDGSARAVSAPVTLQ